MSFSAFSEEFHANMFTNVENAFITRYLPWADGDAVRVYLYGLYLCSKKEDVEAETAAKLLKLSEEKFREIYRFWEECGLVHILSEDPLRLVYLPVSSSLGKPKPVRPEKYSEFNKELYRRLQKINRDITPPETKKIIDFLENNEMEPMAFLLVCEYSIAKKEEFNLFHILKKAKQLVDAGKLTYESVEEELADFNRGEELLEKIFKFLEIFRDPNGRDREFLEKWQKDGVPRETVLLCAEHMKKGTLGRLDSLLEELKNKGIHNATQAKKYLEEREKNANLVFAVARKIGVKVENPRAYAEEYIEKWEGFGYGEESILSVAAFAFKLRFGFSEMDALLGKLHSEGIKEGDVKEYCSSRENSLKLLNSIQTVCSSVKNSLRTLNTVAEWRKKFSDDLILTAAQKSAEASAPLSYMNKLLLSWEKDGITSPENIPEKAKVPKELYRETAIAADKRADREHYYAIKRENAIDLAEKNREKARQDQEFSESEKIIKRGEIELAKAELYAPQTLPDILKRMQEANERRKSALTRLGLTEEDLQPKFSCPLCSDTGFLPNGVPCKCYKNFDENLS